MAPRRRKRLHPQIPPIHASEDGAGVARRFHPQIHASDEGAAGVTSPAAEAAASLPDDDDILREILVRLPPQPSSLPRASAVCKRWRGLVTDPKFHRQFYAHHRKPPLLGVIQRDRLFNPMLDRPDRIPPRRLSLLRFNHDDYDVLNCRHGLVLIQDCKKKVLLVCDPVTRKHRRVAIPPELSRATDLGGAVLCAATDVGHVHGGCHSTPFKVVLVSTGSESDSRGCLACVYSSQTRIWGNFLISTAFPCELCEVRATLVGNALYWLLCEGYRMLEFDLDGQSLAVIEGPPIKDDDDVLYGNYHIIQGEDAAVGFVILSHPRLQTWQRKVWCCHVGAMEDN